MGAPRPTASPGRSSIEEVELAPPGRGEVLVRDRARPGLCHSDLSVINGDRPRPMPMALGHEAAGEVDAARRRRRRPCREATTLCWCSCRAAATARRARKAGPRCASRAPRPTARARCSPARGGSRSATATPINHHLGCSAFAEHAVVSRRSLRQDRSRAAVRRGSAVRLRGADGCRRGREHGASARGARASLWSAWAVSGWRRCSAPCCGCARDRRRRPVRRRS